MKLNFMDLHYIRNRIYISSEEQKIIKDYKILIAGAGIGSVIAESLLRLGFENITIVDGDKVECSNLNRQNYTINDIGISKAVAIKNRLLSINPDSRIESIDQYITADNLHTIVADHNVAINALDFDGGVPLIFDNYCFKNCIKVLHPYNLGWAAFVLVFSKDTDNIEQLGKVEAGFEKEVAKFIIQRLKDLNLPYTWFDCFLNQYNNDGGLLSPPQLSVGVSLLAGIVTTIVFDIATDRPVRYFPNAYYLSVKE